MHSFTVSARHGTDCMTPSTQSHSRTTTHPSTRTHAHNYPKKFSLQQEAKKKYPDHGRKCCRAYTWEIICPGICSIIQNRLSGMSFPGLNTFASKTMNWLLYVPAQRKRE